MGIKKCENGHFYDNEKYSFCPVCLYQNQEDRFPPEEKTICASTENLLLHERTIGYAMLDDDAFAKPVAGWVVCLEGNERGRDWRIYEGKNFIGQSSSSDICISDDGIRERDHASIIYDGRHNVFWIVPGKGAIIYLNGDLLTDSSILKNDDEIKLGKTKLCFRSFCEGERTWQSV